MYILAIILAYLLGSIPSAYLLGKKYNIDIRTKGSGNVGTMNTRAVLGWKTALLVLLIDLAKGAAAVSIAQFAGVDLMLAASIAVLGHICPIWLNFQGGKGLATAAGALIAACSPLTVVIFAIVFCLIYPLIKQVDLVNLLGTAAAVSVSTIIYGPDRFLLLLGVIICVKHISVMIKTTEFFKKIQR